MSKEAMKLALEALKNFEKAGLATLKTIDAITAIKEALEQPEPVECHTCKGLGRIYMGCGSWIHCDTCNTTGKATTPPKREPEPEPVAWTDKDFTELIVSEDIAKDIGATVPLYASPPQREPLTDEQMEQIHQQYGGNIKKIMRAVEAAHGIKGEQHGTR